MIFQKISTYNYFKAPLSNILLMQPKKTQKLLVGNNVSHVVVLIYIVKIVDGMQKQKKCHPIMPIQSMWRNVHAKSNK